MVRTLSRSIFDFYGFSYEYYASGVAGVACGIHGAGYNSGIHEAMWSNGHSGRAVVVVGSGV